LKEELYPLSQYVPQEHKIVPVQALISSIVNFDR